MAKSAGAVRVTISVPAKLKKRMERCKRETNWSAIAARAFSEYLSQIDFQKQEKNMADVKERSGGSCLRCL